MTEPSDNQTPPPWARTHLWDIRFVRDLFWIAAAIFALWFGYKLRTVFTPVLIGLVFAYLFHPLITYMQKRYRWPRPVTISGILTIGLTVMFGFALWLGPQLVRQVGDLAGNVPGYIQDVSEWYEEEFGEPAAQTEPVSAGEQTAEEENGTLKTQIDRLAKKVENDPAGYLANAMRWIMVGTGSALDVLGRVLEATTYLLMMFTLIPIYFFFFAWSFGPMVDTLKDYFPASKKDEAFAVLAKMDEAVGSYFRDRIIISFIMAAMFAIGWSPLISGVPYWLLLAIITGLLSLIPYAAVVGWLAALLLKSLDIFALDGEIGAMDWVWGLGGLTTVYIVVQVFEGWLLTPWIQGKSLNMSSITILIVVFIGGAIGGMYGLILCIPIAACLKILTSDVLLPRFKTWCAEH